jgi:heat shock protein 5
MKYNDKSVQNDIKHFPFKVINQNGQPRVKVEVHNEEKTFTPEEISAMVLGSECLRSAGSADHIC